MKPNYTRFYEIERKPQNERTEEEKAFYRFMYQLEEQQCNLDCERDLA